MPKKTSKRPKPTLSKAEAIRTYKRENPESKPKQISEILNKQGYKVNPQYVSMILSSERRKQGTAKSRLPIGITGRGGSQLSVDDLIVAKSFVKKMGSVDAAKAAVDAFARIADDD